MTRTRLAQAAVACGLLVGFLVVSAGPASADPPTVSLSISQTNVWVGQSVTLTATSSVDLILNNDTLEIFEDGTLLQPCSIDTTCTATATSSTAGVHFFSAELVFLNDGTVEASDPNKTTVLGGDPVVWHATTVKLAASPTTLMPGGTTTLTATTANDVGPSPYYIEIFDVTAGSRLSVCGSGTTCTATESQSQTITHQFVAYVSANSTALPPASTVAQSATSYVTWRPNGYTLSLATSSSSNGALTVTATSSVDVGPTPYFIQIYGEDTGNRICSAGSGTTCSTSFTPASSGSHLVAFIGPSSTTLNPPAILASSNVLYL
jgi:hypothetical protein